MELDNGVLGFVDDRIGNEPRRAERMVRTAAW
jgi:hypothetical protein